MEVKFKSLANEHVDVVVRRLKKDGTEKFEYGNVNITLLQALFAENGLDWDGYFMLAPGESIEDGFSTKRHPAAIKLKTRTNPKAESYLLRVDSDILQLRLNDGKSYPMVADASIAWLETQYKAYGKDFLSKMKEVCGEKIADAEDQIEFAKQTLARLHQISKTSNRGFNR